MTASSMMSTSPMSVAMRSAGGTAVPGSPHAELELRGGSEAGGPALGLDVETDRNGLPWPGGRTGPGT